MENLREFASSTNGDRWFLGVDKLTDTEFVIHRGNPSSGGHETTTLVSEFLQKRPFGPERDALILILADRPGESGEIAAGPV
ncbi:MULTISPECIES: hypothetical protein [unclassified Rhizobium]|uniref:hypothetical protein n=1 Tax=unclassified Rhizobium TaxID=2613769 RepID=UPI00161F068E|nr:MULTISPECIES: hypothetical protein [unclassified Rhizobium]MBB3319568.1 hypothetical protein [Rhizobium sp. BK181]MCS4095181.1 hypothetical protein [Rhizobium sp. BK176]